MTRSSHPLLNTMHNAPFPENDGRVACSIFFSLLPHNVFTSGGDSVREFPGQDEVTICQQRKLPARAISRECVSPWAVTSNYRHGPPQAIPLRTCRGLRGAEEKGQPGWRRAFECFDRRPDISLYHGELLRAIKELEEDVLSCRSGEAAATARVSLFRGLASAGNSADLDVAPSYSRGRNETSCTGPNAPPELA